MFNAVMDSVETTISFKKTIFSKFKPEVWCKPISAHFAKNFPFTTAKKDAWHTAKFFNIFSTATIIIGLLIWPHLVIWPININWLYLLQNFIWSLHWSLQLLSFFILMGIYGLFRNSVFGLFFDRLFRLKA